MRLELGRFPRLEWRWGHYWFALELAWDDWNFGPWDWGWQVGPFGLLWDDDREPLEGE